jgi:hypothetical protein
MRLTPDTFWSMSLIEWRAAVEGFASLHRRRTSSLLRAEFEQMMRMFPDCGE